MSNMNYSSVADFFNGAYLDIRHTRVLESIKHHSNFAARELLQYMERNNSKLSIVERSKLNAYVSDLSEVFFMCENLHFYIKGMDRVTSSKEEIDRKTVEIKNQGQWIARHLPSMWDGVMIYTRFESTMGKYLTVHPQARLHFFEAVNPAICDLSKAPFAFLKLKSVVEADRMTSAIMASCLAKTVTNMSEIVISVDAESSLELAKVQAHNYEKLSSSVFSLIKEYEKSMLRGLNMGESEEALRLIDELELHIKQLCKDYEDVLRKVVEKKNNSLVPRLDVDVFDKAVNNLYDKMTEIIKRRLG